MFLKLGAPPRGHLEMSGDIFDGHESRWEAATGIQWVETRDVAKHPTMHRTAPQQRVIWPQCHYVEAELKRKQFMQGLAHRLVHSS